MADYPRPPQVSRKRLTKAGKTLAKSEMVSPEYLEARELVDQWRAAHSYPMVAARNNLSQRARGMNSSSIVVQRLKRLPSIINKLRRGVVNDLARIQDIGGCRAILPDLTDVLALVETYEGARRDRTFTYSVRNHYIQAPKINGYRGVHIVGERVGGKFPEFQGFHVEIQLRTALMHSWATAVEIVDTFAGEGIKTSDPTQIVTEWDHFFALISAAMAIEEGTAVPDGTPVNRQEIRRALRGVRGQQHVSQIRNWTYAMNQLLEGSNRGSYFLLQLYPQGSMITSTRFSNPVEADLAYRHAEAQAETDGADVVLVAGQTIDDVRRAYPNYFPDATGFVKFVESILD